MAEFNNAKNNSAMLELLWKNALRLDLTGFDQLDYMEECIVVQTLLDKNRFANRAAVQTAVTEGIKLAQDDAQANAYMKALFSYTPELSVEDNICTVTYPDELTTAQQSLLNGLYADLVILIDTPLSNGEVFELTVGKTTIPITNRDLSGKEILLSKLLGRKLVDGDLIQNQKSTVTITVKDVSTKVERYVTVCPCTSKNGDEYIKNFTNAYALKLSPSWLVAYTDGLTIDYQNSEFLFNYAGNLTDEQKQGLADYYADTIIQLARPLAADESIKISAMGKEATLTSSTVTENEDKTEIRLSKLMVATSNLAVDQKDEKVCLTDINLTRSNVIFVNPVLVKTNEASIYAGSGAGAALYPTWIDEYRDSVSLTAENSQIIVNYKGGLSPAAVTGLKDYQADVMIYLDRELEEGETIAVSAFKDTKPLTKGKMDGTQIKLSDLMDITQKAAGKSGDDVIEFSVDGLNRNIRVYANPILINTATDGIEYLNYGTSLSLYQPSFKAYSDSIELSSEDNKILVNYTGSLSPVVQAKLAGYYADTMIYLDKALEEGEIVTVKASNLNEPVVITNTSPAEDSEKQSYRLAKLLDIERDEANLAVNQTGSFEIAVDENTLKKQMYISATAILVKDDQIEYLDHYTGMSINPPSFEAYDKSVEILTDTNQGFTVTHKDELTTVDVNNLVGLYGDTLISFERPLAEGESIKVHAYGEEEVITSSSFKEWSDNRIGLTELLGISSDNAPLAKYQGDDIKISFSDVNLKSSNSIAAWNGLNKSDGTCVYRGNSGFGIFIYPSFMDAYKNSISLVPGVDKISVTYLNQLTPEDKEALSGYYADTLIYLSRPLVDDETVTINAFGIPVTVDSSKVTENNGTQIRLSDLLNPLDEEKQLAAKQTGFDITVTDKSLKSDLMVTAEAILRKGKVIEYLHQSTGIELKAQTIQDTEDPCITNAIIELSDGDNVPLDLKSGILTLERYAITKKIEFDMNEAVVLSANPVLQIRLDNQLVEYGKIEYADENHQKLIVTPNSEALGTAGRLGYFAFTLPDDTITDMSGNEIKGINGDYLDQILLKVVDTAVPTIEGITAMVDDVEIEAIKNNEVFEMNVLQNSVTSEIRVKMSEPVTVKDGATILIHGTSTSYGSIEVDSNDSTFVVIKPASPEIGTAGQLGLTTFSIPENLVCDLVDNDSSNIQSPSSIAFEGGGLGNAQTSFNLNVLAPDTEKPTMTALTAILNNNSDTTVNATENPLKLVLDKDSLTTQIVVELNENVTFKNGAILDEGAVVTMSGEGVQEGTIYGKIYREGSIKNQLIIVPNGTNGIAGLTGTFTFKVAADTIFDSSNNGNAETSFTLEVVEPVV
ncbi:MAG: hypothetical protein ABGU93_10860 [Acetobacterium sp.]|uniref:hypothetical protein n=1 Tax=Acetobacterium sp. TaxID=1872094 RepID=UPI003242B622